MAIPQTLAALPKNRAIESSALHEAWNDSEEIRIILIFDIWNPLLSVAERDLVRALTLGIGLYYGVDAPVPSSR
jgi:Aspartyl/Asparaginyl beta-hydroxylase